MWGTQGDGAPLHRHPDTETFVVTRGRLRFWADGELTECGPGESVTLPSGVPHTYVVLEEGSEWLLLLTDSAFDRFIMDVAAPVRDLGDPSEGAGSPDPARVEAAGAALGMEILGLPPPELRA